MTKLHIDACDRMGNTLLMTAAQNNHKEVVKECLKRGARINLQNKKVMSLSLSVTPTPIVLPKRSLHSGTNRPSLRLCLWLHRACQILNLERFCFFCVSLRLVNQRVNYFPSVNQVAIQTSRTKAGKRVLKAFLTRYCIRSDCFTVYCSTIYVCTHS